MSNLIAVVDDDRDAREVIQCALETAGYTVKPVSSGLGLLSALVVDHPDLILMDVRMSWIDGIELCRLLKQNDAYKDIPIIFISAATETAQKIRGEQAGGCGYICKPFSRAELLERVAVHVKP